MVQVHILVEGQTEEAFVKEILSPFLLNYNLTIIPIIISTKRTKEGRKFKGGLTNANFNNFISDLKGLIRSTPQGYVTTFIDYYGIPSKFPGYEERVTMRTQLNKVLFLEEQLANFLHNHPRFIPYIQLHEFEAFLFTDSIGFQKYLSPNEANLEHLIYIIENYPNPEDINEGTETAPSKRILSNYRSYEKVNDGNLILLEIGIEKLIEKCSHFKSFIDKLIVLK